VEMPAAAGQWWRVDDAELRTALTDTQTAMRRNYHAMLELVREADTRGLASSSGYPSLPALLSHLLRIPAAQATQLVEQAWLVIPGESLTGAATAPTLAHTAQALAAGVLGADHVAAIATVMAALPGWLDTAARQDIEATLAETAHSTDATVIRKLGSKILARLDQDGPQPSDDQPGRGNQLRTRTRRDGRMSFTGEIDPQAAALFTELLGPLAKPVPAGPEGRDPRARRSGWGMPSSTSWPWPRVTRMCRPRAGRNPPSWSPCHWKYWKPNSALPYSTAEASSAPHTPA
jgi:hypothetical protein